MGTHRHDHSFRGELLDVVGRNGRDHVDLASDQRVDPRRGLGDGSPDDSIEIGIGLVPVVGVAFVDDALAAHALDEPERPGADGVLLDLLVAPLLDGLGAHVDGDADARRLRELVDEERERLGERELHGVLVDRLHRVQVAPYCEFQASGAVVVVLEALVPHPPDVEHDRIGVERRSIVELDAFAETDGVHEAVIGDLVAGRELRDDGWGAAVVRPGVVAPEQAFE